MEIMMRTPEGKPSKIKVDRIPKGISLYIERGNYVADITLPSFAARAVAEAMLKLLGPIE